ncbi:hypothetical protein E2K98_10105 [Bacillus salipaludis]|uniref:Uncharacterized protein n=1 Tax=Bacillus salipaludis TaxID=2547811 RepID=A0A4R5VUS0_9BACI|nr:hypothetical protein [Bacillus salipaludis]MDQ6600143.1 hypothetical protein [Bacillus salipaludis]TDK62393.1 hypothetical protein E2K98_10105 [Bacillus salipaludis]
MSNKNGNFSELEQKRLNIEKQISLGIWIQVIGATIEFLGIAKLREISDNPDSIPEKEVLTGAGIQALGTFFEAIGVSGQITGNDNKLKLDAQKLAITGDWLQSIGAALEAAGGTGEFLEEQEKANLFVP